MDINVDRSFRRYPRHIKEVQDRPEPVKKITKFKLDEEPKANSQFHIKVLILLLIIAVGLAIACRSCLLLERGFFCLSSQVGDWSRWSPCSNLCGTGNQTRHRSSPDGKSTETEARQCIDGSGCNVTSSVSGAAAWSTWSKWSTCSKTCDKGTQMRTRECLSGTASRQIVDSTMCQPGQPFEKQSCFSSQLCVPFAWTRWSDWSQCDKSCVNQSSIRTRSCTDGKSAVPIESRKCPSGVDNEFKPCICYSHSVFFNYHNITGLNCINSKFIRDLKINLTFESCAGMCDNTTECQAFTMHRGHCRMFVFNRCSKKVRSCHCNHQTTVYMKRREGLKPGALCPAGYGYHMCGVKYKFLETGLQGFDANFARCNAEPGLVILAEIMDSRTLREFSIINHGKPHQANYTIGGRQIPGSVEPAAGWFWWTCHYQIDRRLWTFGKPDDTTGAKNIASFTNGAQLRDKADTSINAICECLSPFESNII